ncbi:uncharacterized protein LOC112682609 [Sipha flava]|uniref:Uncharacterized protein LOC112682609 n=1 Tax=Sipha flava TaxID=143950 RepID=A0A8B8FFA5_9HEMI|nr:uncharacterized protein LOC112682609 [Sipha flava]
MNSFLKLLLNKMKNFTILSMIIALLVIGQVFCQNTRRRGDGRDEYRQQYPRPSRPPPGGRWFGENYGWQYQRGGDYWYHPQSVWRWQPNNGWMNSYYK